MATIRLRQSKLHRDRRVAREALDAIDRVLGYDPHPSRTSDPVGALCDRARNLAQAVECLRPTDHDHAEVPCCAEGATASSSLPVISGHEAGSVPAPGVVPSQDGTCYCDSCDCVEPEADAAASRIAAVLTLTSAAIVIIVIAALVGLL